MSLIINHNMMAQNTARNLNTAYGRLSTSIQRLSSGMRVNSGADDAAGLAIREMMRADISTTMQGLRNAADGISLIQTADGALAVIDEKLVRMKELAEQAATGTYTTAQREIINSEYQAMANEIDRIANATNFNGIKLLDGSISNLHGGQGLKVHFGVGNSEAEDYYFINMGDARATSKTGLRIGGDAKNDIWGQGAAGAKGNNGPGCCTRGFATLDERAGFVDGQSFSYGYNWDWMAQNDPRYDNGDPNLLTGKYLAGRYTVTSAESLQDLINKVNAGTQSRVGIKIDTAGAAVLNSGGSLAVCVGEEAYIWGDMEAARGGEARVAQYRYSYTDEGYWSNADKTVFTNSATVASALGFSQLTWTATTQRTTDPEDAAAEINRQITKALIDGKFVGQTQNRNAVSADGTAGLYYKALEYLTLDKETAGPAYLTAKDIDQAGWKVQTSAAYYSATATHSAFTLADVYSWAVDPLQTGDRVVSNVWVNAAKTQWTSSDVVGEQLQAWNYGGSGWSRLSIQIESGDTYEIILNKFNQAFSAAATHISGIVVLGAASGGVLDGNSAFGIWYSADTHMWTKVQGVASALSLTSSKTGGTFTSGTSLATYLAAANAAIASITATLDTKVNSTHAIIFEDGQRGGVGTHAINFWTDGTSNWTDDKALGDAMGYNQVVLNMTYNQRIDDIMNQLSLAVGTQSPSGIDNVYFGSTTFSLANASMATQTASNVAGSAVRIDDTVMHLNGFVDFSKQMTLVGTGQGGFFNAYSLASAINHNKNSQFWAMMDKDDPTNSTLYVFNKEGGAYNSLLACDVYDIDVISQKAIEKYVDFENVEHSTWHKGGMNFTLGTDAASVWGKMKPSQSKQYEGNQVWNVTLNGKDVGDLRDLWITAARDLSMPGIGDGFEDIITGLDRHSFTELQNATYGLWDGADVRTQSNAQAALDALNYSINVKDKVRADLGAIQNRLQNTMTNLEIQAENLQASESRISDVDVASEMTEFTKNNILTQAAVGMLSQANSMGQLALSLLR